MTFCVTINVWSSVSWVIGTVQVESNSSTHTFHQIQVRVQEWWLLSEILSKEITNKRNSDTAQKMSFFLVKTRHEESVKRFFFDLKRDIRTTIASSSITHVENHRKFFFPMDHDHDFLSSMCMKESALPEKEWERFQMRDKWVDDDHQWRKLKGQYRRTCWDKFYHVRAH